jgi:hypothetical protein
MVGIDSIVVVTIILIRFGYIQEWIVYIFHYLRQQVDLVGNFCKC